jgi:hypothetical protein
MIMKIRYGAFETNSSSAHSIVLDAAKDKMPPLTKEEALKSLSDICEGELIGGDELDLSKVNPNELRFGWGYDTFGDFGHKLFYTLATCRYDADKFDDLERFIKEFFGVKRIKYAPDEYGGGKKLLVGVVDHQSMSTLSDFCVSGGVTAIDFILNRKYILIVDNDNG